MRMIDLRSDTVTLPTPAMLAAMSAAELGDDVYGDDPTVNRLEALAAERLGKEAAVLVASGTMGNLCSLLAHCGSRGQEAIVGDRCHIYNYEAGGAAALGGIIYRAVPTAPTGELPLAVLHGVVSSGYDAHNAPTRVVCLENTHNSCGGVVLQPTYMEQVRTFADQHGLAVHLDGARIFNAAVALGVDVREFTRHVDSVTFCLSKGLSAPVGSVVCGSSEFIGRVRRARKMVGGGMRQAGIIAAAGIVALEEMVDRLAEDHTNARTLAEGLARFPQLGVDLATIQTDIVYFDLRDDAPDGRSFIAALKERGVLIGGGGRRVRAVTHYGIEPGDIEETLEAVRQVLAS
ncbi:MAG TPA: low-specificity L-threonine aldolase [Roseiflexaceae bacterium]|nr:low-specificity L-threonine aldolase [Roseiflexaceae bacterium]HMP38752.1 low-specificity L-threonine aldolase [Roseiflexaceae bacterium]